jgi:hypothetical protein
MDLPPSMKYHNVFYILLLEPTTSNAYPIPTSESRPLVDIDREDKYFIEVVSVLRIHQCKLPYLM